MAKGDYEIKNYVIFAALSFVRVSVSKSLRGYIFIVIVVYRCSVGATVVHFSCIPKFLYMHICYPFMGKVISF